VIGYPQPWLGRYRNATEAAPDSNEGNNRLNRQVRPLIGLMLAASWAVPLTGQFVLLPVAPRYSESRAARHPERCTPVPALYEEWKAKTGGAQATDSAVRRLAEARRGSITFDPFDAVIGGDRATRKRLGERVLWEDDSVIVIVAKPAFPRDVLAIPKREMMFPFDASEGLLKRLATVAAATSDAFIQSANKHCDASLVSSISISRPTELGVKHLHVHVQPPPSILVQDEQKFYSRMSQHLGEILSSNRKPE